LTVSSAFHAPPHDELTIVLDVFATFGVHKLVALIAPVEGREFAFFISLGREAIAVRPDDFDVSH
jgi:hypothetical protein